MLHAGSLTTLVRQGLGADFALSREHIPQEYATLLENITTETERLGHLISDLLALARSDEGQKILEQEPVRLDLLVRAVAANAEVLAAEKKHNNIFSLILHFCEK